MKQLSLGANTSLLLTLLMLLLLLMFVLLLALSIEVALWNDKPEEEVEEEEEEGRAEFPLSTSLPPLSTDEYCWYNTSWKRLIYDDRIDQDILLKLFRFRLRLIGTTRYWSWKAEKIEEGAGATVWGVSGRQGLWSVSWPFLCHLKSITTYGWTDGPTERQTNPPLESLDKR